MPKSNRLALALALALGCGEAPVEPAPVGGTLEILVPTHELRPGRVMQAEARLLSAEGEVLEGARVTWRSLTPNTVQVDSAGRLLGIAPGAGIVRVSAGGLATELALVLRNPPTRAITLDATALRLSLPTGTRQLVAVARDSVGDAILGATLQWGSSATRIAAVSALGQVSAVAVGSARIVAQVDGVTTALDVEVVADPTPTAPVLDAIAPLLVVPGQTLVVNGAQFAPAPAANTVLLDGVPVPVTQASATRLVLAIPAATSFVCAPRRTVALQIGTAGGIGVRPVPLEVATARTLALGDFAVLTPAAAHCLDLSATPGRYRLAVVNAARAIGAPAITPTLTGVTPEPGASAFAAALAPALERAGEATWALDPAPRHTAPRQTMRAATPMPRLVEPRVGELRQLRLPALGTPDLCTRFTPITARVAWVGRRIAILEDTTTSLDGVRTLAGTQDALYAQVGAELDSLGWAIVRPFGDPLVMDARLDDDGRVGVVLTPRMNTALGGGALAATVTCDLFPRAQFPASDMGEYIYAQVPTVHQSGEGLGTPARWRREMRATLVHELKHVASYAERVVRGQPLEEPWLEEAAARHAEELFARALYGHRRGSNVGFATSLACELAAAGGGAGCLATARAMQPHLEGLYEMLRASATRSPLGPTSAGDVAFYGAAWALTRWVLDQQGGDESAQFAALTTGGLTGIANLEARAQRPWEEFLPEWALTMMVDDAGFTLPARLSFPSWDLRSQFRGLCEQVGRCLSPSGDPRFPFADPVRAVRLTPASLAASIGPAPPTLALGPIVPGGFAPLELTIAAGGNGVVGVTGGGTLRLGLVRVE